MWNPLHLTYIQMSWPVTRIWKDNQTMDWTEQKLSSRCLSYPVVFLFSSSMSYMPLGRDVDNTEVLIKWWNLLIVIQICVLGTEND